MKLSIITINRNNAAGLCKTMESVFAQTYKEFEYIVVDGASDDDSVNVIKELESEGVRELGAFKWISEPDTGIYNAMNKGLKMAKGEYTLMLNSGDFLVDEYVLERIIPELDGTDIIQGNNIEERQGVVYRNRGYGRSDIDIVDVMKGHFLHQASFCRRDLFEQYGYFDETYRISGDTKFFMNSIGVHDATFRYVDIEVANYDCDGVSALQNGQWNECGRKEYHRLLGELFPLRLQKHFYENARKIQMYDKLHQHKWIWSLVMMLSRLHDLFYGIYTDHPQPQRIK